MKTHTATIARLATLGISAADIDALFRISATLRTWFTHECNGDIQRNESDGIPHWVTFNRYTNGYDKFRTADREKGARRRLEAIMANYPELTAYIQTDPRGCSLYILSAVDLGTSDIHQVYYRGVAVCK